MIINKDCNRNFVPDIKIEYNTPVPLIQVLRDLKAKEQHEHRMQDSSLDVFIKNVAKDEVLSSNKVKKYVQKGSSAIAFETPDGDILKLSIGNHFPMSRPQENFDVPIKKQGRSGKVFYYLEEKLYQHGLSEGFVEVIREKIKENGLYLLDEPENSLSPQKQQELLRFLEDSVRFFKCQFVIATHSPFLLSMRGAKIYDLDVEVADVKRWTELGNVRAYYDFFKKYEREFEI